MHLNVTRVALSKSPVSGAVLVARASASFLAFVQVCCSIRQQQVGRRRTHKLRKSLQFEVRSRVTRVFNELVTQSKKFRENFLQKKLFN